jgi:hypothetical protein
MRVTPTAVMDSCPRRKMHHCGSHAWPAIKAATRLVAQMPRRRCSLQQECCQSSRITATRLDNRDIVNPMLNKIPPAAWTSGGQLNQQRSRTVTWRNVFRDFLPKGVASFVDRYNFTGAI